MVELSGQRIEEINQKIQKSKEVFDEAFKKYSIEETRLIWSAGKDSTLALWICREYCKEKDMPMPTAFTIDEFDVFPEIDEMLKKYSKEWDFKLDWGLNEDVVKAAGRKLDADVHLKDLNERNKKEIARIGFGDLEKFPFEAESYIGNHLMKTVTFNGYIEENNVKAVFQGLRWDEHPSRKDDEYFEEASEGELSPAHMRIRPILQFTERDIWDTTLHNNIPYCVLYKSGYRSLGAKTTSQKLLDIPAWEQDLENTEERAGRRQDKEKTMERLRQLGYM